MEKWVNKTYRCKGLIFDLAVGEVRLDNGRLAQRDIIEHNGGVAIVPVLDDAVVLIRQFRIAVECELLEIPAGKLEGDEDPLRRARLELEEETGYRAGRMELAASYYSSAGFTNERMRIYFAYDLEKTAQQLEEDEQIEPVIVPIAEIERKLNAREFEDAKTIIGLRELLAIRRLGDKFIENDITRND